MEHSAKIDNQADPYGRLLQRLTSALDEASSLARLSDEPSSDMEVRGLSAAELALIKAYLANDHDWLRGWRAIGIPQYPPGVALLQAVSPPFKRHYVSAVGNGSAYLPKHGARVVAED